MGSSKKTCIYDSVGLAEKLQKGSAALFPTDTLPALASCPDYAHQLWKIKKRPIDKPLILMGSSQKQLFDSVLSVALEDANLMANRYWPGALTMILPATGPIVKALNPGKFTLGMRVPDCKLAIKLLAKSGPLATTSANLAGSQSSLDENEASNYFPELPLLGPIPWPKASGLASTLILWQSPGRWKILRKGAVIIKDSEGQ